jgi:hypothetical protein
MLQQDELKSFTLESLAEVLEELRDSVAPPCHCDLYDDGAGAGASPGRIASFDLDANGKLTWWSWRSDDACARAEWPLKLKMEFANDDRRTVWLRGKSWDIEDYRRSRVARLA